jgi:hypothetical protein
MPWELGYFDGFNGNVAILPVVPDTEELNFDHEEYLQIYPKVDVLEFGPRPRLFVNRARRLEGGKALAFEAWQRGTDKLRPDFDN